MKPTEAISTLYYDDMDILHIDNWRVFFTPKKRERSYTPNTETIPHLLDLDTSPTDLKRGRALLPGAKLSAQAVKFAPTI